MNRLGFSVAAVCLLLSLLSCATDSNGLGSGQIWGNTIFAGANPTTPAGTTPTLGAASGNFRVSGGKIIDPSGAVWAGKGINVYDNQLSSVVGSDGIPLLTLFPKLSFIRIPCYSYQDDAAFFQQYVTTLTSKKIVVLLENHRGPLGLSGGGAGSWTGAELTTETNWYAGLAAAFKDNPYVWFGTLNEPSGTAAEVSSEQVATYQAIRGAGNNNIVAFQELYDLDTTGVAGQYSTMTNVIWDIHFYGWLANYSTDQATVQAALTNQVANVKKITSTDGTMPVMVGEYGDATNDTQIDPNGTQVVIAVGASGFPSTAWEWDPSSLPNDALTKNGQLTSYGQQVAAIIAQSPSGKSVRTPHVVGKQ